MLADQLRQSKPKWAAWPQFSEEEVAKVSEILRSGKVNYWTGHEGQQFEKEYAASLGLKYAVALMNGTVALEAALYAWNVGPGDEVITTAKTFIATASAIIMRGAKPVLADVDPDSQNITVETIRPLVTPKTKGIIVVHLAGWPCDMLSICKFAKEHELFVIEDCAQAHGACIDGQQVGSFGDISTFSFCQDKILTTGGEGGMLVTNNPMFWEKIWSYKDHGKSYHAVHRQNHPPGFRWVHESFGTNLRMTEMQAAIGRLQLKKLPQWLQKRRRNADILKSYLKQLPQLRIPEPSHNIEHAYYKFYAFVQTAQAERDRNYWLQILESEGIPCFTGVCSEIYLEIAFKESHLGPQTRLPVAKRLSETSLMFLVHPTLSDEEVHFMGQRIVEIINNTTNS